jgi:hypothetical protein
LDKINLALSLENEKRKLEYHVQQINLITQNIIKLNAPIMTHKPQIHSKHLTPPSEANQNGNHIHFPSNIDESIDNCHNKSNRDIVTQNNITQQIKSEPTGNKTIEPYHYNSISIIESSVGLNSNRTNEAPNNLSNISKQTSSSRFQGLTSSPAPKGLTPVSDSKRTGNHIHFPSNGNESIDNCSNKSNRNIVTQNNITQQIKSEPTGNKNIERRYHYNSHSIIDSSGGLNINESNDALHNSHKISKQNSSTKFHGFTSSLAAKSLTPAPEAKLTGNHIHFSSNLKDPIHNWHNKSNRNIVTQNIITHSKPIESLPIGNTNCNSNSRILSSGGLNINETNEARQPVNDILKLNSSNQFQGLPSSSFAKSLTPAKGNRIHIHFSSDLDESIENAHKKSNSKIVTQNSHSQSKRIKTSLLPVGLEINENNESHRTVSNLSKQNSSTQLQGLTAGSTGKHHHRNFEFSSDVNISVPPNCYINEMLPLFNNAQHIGKGIKAKYQKTGNKCNQYESHKLTELSTEFAGKMLYNRSTPIAPKKDVRETIHNPLSRPISSSSESRSNYHSNKVNFQEQNGFNPINLHNSNTISPGLQSSNARSVEKRTYKCPWDNNMNMSHNTIVDHFRANQIAQVIADLPIGNPAKKLVIHSTEKKGSSSLLPKSKLVKTELCALSKINQKCMGSRKPRQLLPPNATGNLDNIMVVSTLCELIIFDADGLESLTIPQTVLKNKSCENICWVSKDILCVAAHENSTHQVALLYNCDYNSKHSEMFSYNHRFLKERPQYFYLI